MTSGGYTLAEAYNLQLQGEIQTTKAELKEAVALLRAHAADKPPVAAYLARHDKIVERRARIAMDVKEVLKPKLTTSEWIVRCLITTVVSLGCIKILTILMK